MENRSHQCPICNKVTERGNGPSKLTQKGACEHQRDFLMDGDADVDWGDPEADEEEVDENGEVKGGRTVGRTQ